jgi:2-dehydropantoate 2-reductase
MGWRVAIVGAGAVGGYYGGLLARGGIETHFLLRSDYDVIRQRGLVVRSPAGDFHLPPPRLHLHRDASAMPPVDLVLLATKATANHHLPALLAPLMRDDAVVLCLQNGLGGVETLAETFGVERVLAGLSFICSNRLEPGVITHLGFGLIRFGPAGDACRVDPRDLHATLRAAGWDIELSDDIHRDRWAKLAWNIPFNGLGAVMNLSVDRLIGPPAARALVEDVMGEVIATAEALGHRFPDDLVDQQIAKTARMGAYRTSMQLDRLAGRPMERDAIVDRPLQVARRHGVSVPRIEMLSQQLAAIG